MEPTIHDFASKLPKTDNDDEIVIVASKAMEATITIKVQGKKNPDVSDAAIVGRNVQGFLNMKALCERNKLPSPMAEITEVIGGFDTIIEIWLRPYTPPFPTDFLKDFHQDSSEAVILTAITLALKKEPLTKEAIILKAFSLHKYGIPPVLSADAVRLQRPVFTDPIYDAFARHVVSPFQRNPTTPSPVHFRDAVMQNMCGGAAPSPIQYLQIPEDIRVPNDTTEDGQFQRPGRRRHQRYLYGSGEPPISVEAIYNDKDEKQPIRVRSWVKFNADGGKGIENSNGEKIVIPLNERFRRFTGFVMAHHLPVKGKKIDDPEVIDFMRQELGNHFGDWNKFDWSKINLFQPFPAENPPMKSA